MLAQRLNVTSKIFLAAMLVAMTGCQNHNLFSKLNGKSNDPATLTAEASIALRNKDYGKAIELANQALAQNPNDSQTLYVLSAAEMGAAGLNPGAIVSNVTDHIPGSSAVVMDGLPGLLRISREGAGA